MYLNGSEFMYVGHTTRTDVSAHAWGFLASANVPNVRFGDYVDLSFMYMYGEQNVGLACQRFCKIFCWGIPQLHVSLRDYVINLQSATLFLSPLSHSGK